MRRVLSKLLGSPGFASSSVRLLVWLGASGLFLYFIGMAAGLDGVAIVPDAASAVPAVTTSTTSVPGGISQDVGTGTSGGPSSIAAAGSGQAVAGISLTTTTAPLVSGSENEPTAVAEPPSLDVDVVVYSTQTSGLAAVRELAVGAPGLQVALISSGHLLETPLAQGLGVEDAREIGRVNGGFYSEWRAAVIAKYAGRGIKPYTWGRFVYEPEVSAQALWSFVRGAQAPNVTFYSAKLIAARYEADDRYVDIQVEGQGLVRLKTRFFIDASVEADLARMLGADYRIGRHEAEYNDVVGPRPAHPSAANNYETAPQRFSPLLTLRVQTSGSAPRLSQYAHPQYDPLAYPLTALNKRVLDSFGQSWTMRIAILPNGKRELNEAWNDWPDVGLSFDWIFAPEKRGEIRRRVLQWSINRVRYLQEHGYPRVGLASVPQKLYVREGPRVVGLDTYTVDDLRAGTYRDTVAVGCYVEYDRHDAFYPNQIDTTAYVHVPVGALLAAGHPALIVSTAISTDYQSYCSAVRMEHTRANVGGAAGALVVLADRLGVEPDQVPTADVLAELLARGYKLDDLN